MLIYRLLQKHTDYKKVVYLIRVQILIIHKKGVDNPLFHPLFDFVAAATDLHHCLVKLVAVALGGIAELDPVIVYRRN